MTHVAPNWCRNEDNLDQVSRSYAYQCLTISHVFSVLPHVRTCSPPLYYFQELFSRKAGFHLWRRKQSCTIFKAWLSQVFVRCGPSKYLCRFDQYINGKVKHHVSLFDNKPLRTIIPNCVKLKRRLWFRTGKSKVDPRSRPTPACANFSKYPSYMFVTRVCWIPWAVQAHENKVPGMIYGRPGIFQSWHFKLPGATVEEGRSSVMRPFKAKFKALPAAIFLKNWKTWWQAEWHTWPDICNTSAECLPPEDRGNSYCKKHI